MFRRLSIYFKEMYPILPRFLLGLIIFGEIHFIILLNAGIHAFQLGIQELIGGTVPLREVVIMFYIANEGLSLLENAAIFVPVPDAVKNVLLQLSDKDSDDSEGE